MNLKVSVKDGKECQKVLNVEVAPEHIREEYEKFYKEVAPKAKIPGFRPGKAPREVLAMHFKDEAKQEVLQHLLSQSYSQVLKEKALEPLGYPEIKDVQFDENKLIYSAIVETRPKIKLAKIVGLRAKREKVEVTAAEVEESLKQVQQSLAQYKAVEDRGIAWGDFITADYVCQVEGKEVEKRNDDWFEIKEEEFLKGFSGQLIGAKPGESREVKITFPENFAHKEWQKKEATFQVTVKEIKTKLLPELNDDLARQAGEHKTLEELKEKIRKDMLSMKEQEKEADYEKALLDDLIKNNKIDLPPRVVEKRKEYIMEQRLEHAKRHGLGEDKVEEMKKSLEETVAKEAVRQVHVAFLLDEIALKENVQVGEEDYRKKYQAMSERYRQSLETIEKYYQEHEEALEVLQDQIRNEKAIEFLKANAKA